MQQLVKKHVYLLRKPTLFLLYLPILLLILILVFLKFNIILPNKVKILYKNYTRRVGHECKGKSGQLTAIVGTTFNSQY